MFGCDPEPSFATWGLRLVTELTFASDAAR